MVTKNPIARALFIFFGLLFTAIGAIGVVLPILPTTPFLLLAGFFFIKSSDRLHRWLMNHPKLGPGIQRIREGKGIPLKTKLISLTMATIALGSFGIWGTTNLHARISLAVVLIAKFIAMVKIPTYRGEPNDVTSNQSTNDSPVEPHHLSTNAPTGKTHQNPPPKDRKSISYKITAPTRDTLGIFAIGTIQVIAQTLLALAIGSWAYQLITGNLTIPWVGLALLVSRWVFLEMNRFLGARISQGVRTKVRTDLFRALALVGPDEIRTQGQGHYHELLTDKVEMLDPLYSLYLPQLFIGILSPFAALIIIATRDLSLGLMLLGLLPLTPFILGLLRKGFQRVGKEYSQASSELGSWYVESIRAIPTLTLFQKLHRYKELLANASGQLRDRTIRLLAINQLALLLVELFFSLTLLAAITYLGILRFQDGFLDGATALALPLLAIELIRPINLVGAFFFAGASGRQAKKTLESTLDHLSILAHSNLTLSKHQNQSVKDSKNSLVSMDSQPSSLNSQSPGLVVSNVSFRYPTPEHRTSRLILDQVSLILKPGEILGLQGPSGSGKSTLAKVILGYYEPEAGQIFLDGQDITHLGRDPQIQVKLPIGYLPQRPYLFGWTLRDNIQMGDTSISDQAIVTGLQQVGLQSFVDRGLDTPMGEDAAQVSGGERMRIALARVFVHGARYLILDEPTAEIDSVTEQFLWNHLRASGLGILIIAHRTSTLKLCDRVVSLTPSSMREQEVTL
jgi:ATP-binding cassette subfamily C protein CydD